MLKPAQEGQLQEIRSRCLKVIFRCTKPPIVADQLRSNLTTLLHLIMNHWQPRHPHQPFSPSVSPFFSCFAEHSCSLI